MKRIGVSYLSLKNLQSFFPPNTTNESHYEVTNKKIYLSKHDHLFKQVSISFDHKHIWAIDSLLNVVYQNVITGVITIVFNGYKYVNVSGNGNYLFLIDTNNDLYYYKIDKNKLIYNNYLEFLSKKDSYNKNLSKYKCEIDNVIYPTYDYSKLSRSNQDLIRNNNSATQIDKLSCYQNCNIITNDGITYKKCIKNGENILFEKIKENEKRINENLNSTIQQNKNAELAKKQKEAIEKQTKENNEKKRIDAYKRILNKKYFFEKSDHCNNCIIKSSGTEYMLSRSYDNPEDCFDRAAVLGYNYSTHNPTNKKCYVSNNELFEKDDSLYSGLKTVKIKKLIPDLDGYHLNEMSGGCKERIFNSSPLNVYEKRNTTYISKNPSFKTINSPESHKYNLLKVVPLISMTGYNTELTEPEEIARFLTFNHNEVVGFTDKYAIYKYQKLREPSKNRIIKLTDIYLFTRHLEDINKITNTDIKTCSQYCDSIKSCKEFYVDKEKSDCYLTDNYCDNKTGDSLYYYSKKEPLKFPINLNNEKLSEPKTIGTLSNSLNEIYIEVIYKPTINKKVTFLLIESKGFCDDFYVGIDDNYPVIGNKCNKNLIKSEYKINLLKENHIDYYYNQSDKICQIWINGVIVLNETVSKKIYVGYKFAKVSVMNNKHSTSELENNPDNNTLTLMNIYNKKPTIDYKTKMKGCTSFITKDNNIIENDETYCYSIDNTHKDRLSSTGYCIDNNTLNCTENKTFNECANLENNRNYLLSIKNKHSKEEEFSLHYQFMKQNDILDKVPTLKYSNPSYGVNSWKSVNNNNIIATKYCAWIKKNKPLEYTFISSICNTSNSQLETIKNEKNRINNEIVKSLNFFSPNESCPNEDQIKKIQKGACILDDKENCSDNKEFGEDYQTCMSKSTVTNENIKKFYPNYTCNYVKKIKNIPKLKMMRNKLLCYRPKQKIRSNRIKKIYVTIQKMKYIIMLKQELLY